MLGLFLAGDRGQITRRIPRFQHGSIEIAFERSFSRVVTLDRQRVARCDDDQIRVEYRAAGERQEVAGITLTAWSRRAILNPCAVF